jgi:hypothetical protein
LFRALWLVFRRPLRTSLPLRLSARVAESVLQIFHELAQIREVPAMCFVQGFLTCGLEYHDFVIQAAMPQLDFKIKSGLVSLRSLRSCETLHTYEPAGSPIVFNEE